jgi:hypothetical protein
MATDLGTHFSLLDDLDARQNDVLAQLETLDQRITALLREYSAVAGRTATALSLAPVEVAGLANGPEQPEA